MRNGDEQYAVIPVDSELPLGWAQVGKAGSAEECTAYVDCEWTDMRPMSARGSVGPGPSTPALGNLDSTLVDILEAQVDATPDSVAVVGDTRVFTYAELESRANALARLLNSLNVGRGSLVGLFLRRSMDAVVAIVGVMKAGAAYVPLDPSYPQERIDLMVRDSSVSAIITDKTTRHRCRVDGVPTIVLDEKVLEAGGQRPARAAGPLDLAYVMYTSGSTGTPKGVMVPYRGVVNRISWMQRQFDLASDERTLSKTSLSWDASVWELFWPLTVGASVVVVDTTGASGVDLGGVIRQFGIAVADCTPLQMRDLVAHGRLVHAVDLRVLVTGGESVSPRLVEEYEACGVQAELWNAYGTTETSIASVFCRLRVGDAVDGTMPIGRPIEHTTLSVADSNGRLSHSGNYDELYIGGAAVGRGYLGRPALTALRFLPDPLGPLGSRWYRTGDVGRFLPDGRAVVIGRADDQLKIRGYRVEPAEVEAALEENRDVARAVVTARQRPDGQRRLIGYVVPADDAKGVDLVAARVRAGERLPSYLVPSAIVSVESIPTTVNGKTDFSALPDPGRARPPLLTPFVKPRSRTESRVASVWCDVLDLDEIGVEDDFFELGGDSILATQLISRLDWVANVELRALLESPTVAGLVGRFADVANGRSSGRLVALREDGSSKEPPLVLVHPGGGTLFCYRELIRHGPFDRIFAFVGDGADGVTPPMTSVEDMATAYLSELRSSFPDGRFHLGGWSLGGVIAVAMAHSIESVGGEVESVLVLDSTVTTDKALDEAQTRARLARDAARRSERSAEPTPLDRQLEQVVAAHASALLRYSTPSVSARVDVFLAELREGDRLAEAASWRERCPNAMVHVIADVDHFSILDRSAIARAAALLEVRDV